MVTIEATVRCDGGSQKDRAGNRLPSCSASFKTELRAGETNTSLGEAIRERKWTRTAESTPRWPRFVCPNCRKAMLARIEKKAEGAVGTETQ